MEIRGNMDKVMGIAGQGAARGMWALPSSFSKYKEVNIPRRYFAATPQTLSPEP